MEWIERIIAANPDDVDSLYQEALGQLDEIGMASYIDAYRADYERLFPDGSPGRTVMPHGRTTLQLEMWRRASTQGDVFQQKTLNEVVWALRMPNDSPKYGILIEIPPSSYPDQRVREFRRILQLFRDSGNYSNTIVYVDPKNANDLIPILREICPECVIKGDATGTNTWADLPTVGPRFAHTTLGSSSGSIERTVIEDKDSQCMDPNATPCFVSTVALHTAENLLCSGVLISQNKALTAAHCLCFGGPSLLTFGNAVPLGVYPQRFTPSVTVALKDTVSYFRPEFCHEYLTFRSAPAKRQYPSGDLAILTLDRTLSATTESGAAPYATMADRSDLEYLSEIYVVGYGAREGDRHGGEKHYASIPVRLSDCSAGEGDDRTGGSYLESYGCYVGEEMVAIADGERPPDGCFGDSGGGAYAPSSDGTLALVGIVSRGIPRQSSSDDPYESCGPGGIYLLVATDEVRLWLEEAAPNAVYRNAE